MAVPSSGGHSPLSRSTYQDYLLILGAAVPLGGLVVLFLNNPEINLTGSEPVIWALCFGLFVIADLIGSRMERGLWGGYLNLAAAVAWLTLSVATGLGVVVLGGVAAAVLRGILKGPCTSLTRLQALRLVFRRVTISGLSLLCAAFFYEALGGTVPIQGEGSVIWVALGFSLLSGLLLTYTLGLSLASGAIEYAVIFSTPHIVHELLLLALTAVLPLVARSTGAVVFAVMMIFVAIQALRFDQAENNERLLTRRVRELSLLNKIGEAISSDLVLDDVLLNIYKQVEQLVPLSIFYIALYDKDRDMLDYRLVMASGQPVSWAARKLTDSPPDRVIRSRQALRIRTSDPASLRENAVTASSHSAYSTFVGLPLLAGDDVIGVMAVLSANNDEDFSDDIFDTLKTIASQAGIAVRNALMFTERTALAESLSRISEVTRSGLEAENDDKPLRAACQTAAFITRTGKAAIFLADSHSPERLRLAVGIGLDESARAVYETIANSPQRSLTAEVRIVANISEHPELRPSAQNAPFRAFAEIPLRLNHQPPGLLVVYHDQPNFYRKMDLDLLEILASQVSGLLDNLRFLQVLEMHAYELSALIHLSRISAASLDLNTVARDVASLLRQMMNAHRVIIGLVKSEERRVQIIAVNVDGNVLPRNGSLSFENFAELETLAHEQQPTVRAFTRHSETISSELRRLMAQNSEQSIVMAPIVTDNEPFAVALLGSRELRTYHTQEYQFIEMASNQIAAQLKNAMVYEQTRKDLQLRLAQVALVEDIAKQVSSSLDFDQIISSVVEAAMRATQGDMASLALLTETGILRVTQQHFVHEEIQKQVFDQELSAGLTGQVMRSGKPVIVPNNSLAAEYVTAFPGVYHSSVALPLLDEGKVIGVLNVESREENFFKEKHLSFLNSLADHALISIKNARYLEERRHEINMLTDLHTLSLWLASASDTQSVAEAVLRTALRLVNGQDGVIFNHEAARGQPRITARLWSNERGNERAERLIPAAVAARVLNEGRREIIDEITQDPAAQQDDVFNYRSAAAVPIKHSGRVRSVLFITFAERRILQERELNALDLLASQAAGHLENAALNERIRAARDQMHAILNSTRDGMILLDRTVTLIAANPSAQNLLGIDLENHIGEYFPNVLGKYAEHIIDSGYSTQEVQNIARILRLEPELSTRRQFYYHVNDQAKYIEETGSPVMDENGQIVGRLLVLRDVSDEKLLSEYRGELTHMMVHDLRGPLTAIINALNTAVSLLDSPELIDDIRIVLNAAHFSANRLVGLVNSLLEIASLEGTALQLKLETVTVASLVENAFMSLAASIQQADIKMVFDLPADLPPVNVDREKIERVFINLLDNALRYTPASSEILVAARVLNETQHIQVRIADSGPGIPVHERTRIFDRFRRIKGQEPLRGGKGPGLGLTFCKMAVEAHGGYIRVEDESPLPGACLSFTLPIGTV